MQITSLRIQNFKYIRDLEIPSIENALILVGKNNTGKTGILDAVRLSLALIRCRKRILMKKSRISRSP